MKKTATVATALVGLAILAPSAAADPYVALGDSVAAGAGSSEANTYVNRLFAHYQGGLGADQLLNRSQGGATSSSMRNSGGQLTVALADINATSDTRAVTIDIGGNDRIVCGPSAWDDPAVCPVRANLAAILSELRGALDADPGVETFIAMAYYNPAVGTANEAQTDEGLLGANTAIGCTDTGANAGLNDIIFQEAGRLGVAVADPYPAFKIGGQSYMADAVHPNDTGHGVVAQSFRDAPTAPGPCFVAHAEPPDPEPVDTTPPETTITKAPADKTAHPHAKYKFASSEAGSSFECKFDRDQYAACTSPKTLRNLDPGRHTFRVRATDGPGNVDQTPAVDRFKVVD